MKVSDMRAVITDPLREALADRATVYDRAVDGLAAFPAVAIGMPGWRPINGCWGAWDFPVAVVVGRDGISDEATAADLDDLWPDVLDVLLELRDRQQITDVAKAEFGLFNVQGKQYPAQLITVTLTTNP